MITITEDDVEAAALDWLSGLACQVTHDPDTAAPALHAVEQTLRLGEAN